MFDGLILGFLKALKNGLNGLTNIISKSIIYDGFLKQASISWELENRSPLNKALAKKRKKLPGIFFILQLPKCLHFFIIVFWKLCKRTSKSTAIRRKIFRNWWMIGNTIKLIIVAFKRIIFQASEFSLFCSAFLNFTVVENHLKKVSLL